jgi:murein DD-endopeptidase MepM/ murein hydrolase activator NlpD
MPVRPALAALLALLVLGSAGTAEPAETPSEASASALGVQVVAPGGRGGSAGAVSAPPDGSGGAGGFSFGEGAVSTGAIVTHVTAVAAGRADAVATSSVSAVSLFGGEITVGSVSVKATGGASSSRADGSLASSALSNVQILGQGIAPGANLRVPLGDWGYAVLLQQGVVREDGGGFGFRGTVTGLRVTLTAEHGGLPAGTEILVGYADVGVRVDEQAEPPPPPPARPPVPPGAGDAENEDEADEAPPRKPKPKVDRAAREPAPQPPGSRSTPPPIVRNPPADIKPRLTAAGYVFPVYGAASFSDDFAAARADTGWHHGNDIFAPAGAPVLAVADGELFLVGWNQIGGQRLWLRDDQGNEFYYAHLSAFSPVAFGGSRVRAGDVVGFVGTTGDAEGTPPHLHFEIHPTQLLGLGYDGVVSPYEYLNAWQRLLDASFEEFEWKPRPGRAPPAAAVLLDADDISSAPSLDAESLERVLALPDLFGEAKPFLTADAAQPDLLARLPAIFGG